MKNKILKRAVAVLRKGGIIIFPTATVYGLGADVDNLKTVRKIYQFKGRSENKPLVLMLWSKKQLDCLAVEPGQKKIIKKTWPAPVTFIVKTSRKFSKKFNSHDGTLALRLADQPLTKKIIARWGGYLATTSANFSGERAAADWAQIPARLLKKVDYAIKSGRTKYALPSTIVDLTKKTPLFLRIGAVKKAAILKILKLYRAA